MLLLSDVGITSCRILARCGRFDKTNEIVIFYLFYQRFPAFSNGKHRREFFEFEQIQSFIARIRENDKKFHIINHFLMRTIPEVGFTA